jgi:hypothetical protein
MVIFCMNGPLEENVKLSMHPSTGNVHVRLRLSEGAAHGVWLEGIDDIPSSCVVDELEGDLESEWRPSRYPSPIL